MRLLTCLAAFLVTLPLIVSAAMHIGDLIGFVRPNTRAEGFVNLRGVVVRIDGMWVYFQGGEDGNGVRYKADANNLAWISKNFSPEEARQLDRADQKAIEVTEEHPFSLHGALTNKRFFAELEGKKHPVPSERVMKRVQTWLDRLHRGHKL